MYPQKKEAGIERNIAAASMTPTKISEPDREKMYSGRNTESKPNAISWKKKPSRHITHKEMEGKINFYYKKALTFYKSLIERFLNTHNTGWSSVVNGKV